MVREINTLIDTDICAKKTNGKLCIVHAYNKLNAATIPVQTPISRKDVLQNNTVGCTLCSEPDLVDVFNQLLMREGDIPLTAVSTLSGTLWRGSLRHKGCRIS